MQLINKNNNVSKNTYIINSRFTQLEKSLNNIITRYIKYTDKRFYSDYNNVADAKTSIITDNLFDPVADVLVQLTNEIHLVVESSNKCDIAYNIKSSIQKIEDVFQVMQHDFRIHNKCKGRSLKSINDAKFFRLIQRRINGAREELLKISSDSIPTQGAYHA